MTTGRINQVASPLRRPATVVIRPCRQTTAGPVVAIHRDKAFLHLLETFPACCVSYHKLWGIHATPRTKTVLIQIASFEVGQQPVRLSLLSGTTSPTRDISSVMRLLPQ